MDKYFSTVWTDLGLTRDQFFDLGRQATPWGESFCMPVLALHLSDHANAVSELHGHVSRRMWNFMYPDRPVEAVPITHITNGVHTGTWLARRLRVFSTLPGAGWMNRMRA